MDFQIIERGNYSNFLNKFKFISLLTHNIPST